VPPTPILARALLVAGVVLAVAGCRACRHAPRTPVSVGLNTNNLLDPPAQAESDRLADPRHLFELAERRKPTPTPEQLARRRSVLCLSGGGSYGAYAAGVLNGWTASGDRPGCHDRPNFAVVTGISTGALIAPLAFLGPRYDEQVRRFYTTINQRDVYRLRPVRGVFGLSLADNAPLADLIDANLTPEVVCAVAAEHRKGRRLYVGTTELEGKRFVVWDVGAIACRGDRELIKQVLLGSSAIPGFFPPARIPVTVDGQPFIEEHGDGGASQSIFFVPPFTPPDAPPEATDLAGIDLYMIVSGKLFADAEPVRQRSVAIAASSIQAVLYAQTRGDLQRLFLIATLGGMNYHLAAIPPDFPAPTAATDFDRASMTAMFDEGYRQAAAGAAWRRTPPGVGPGESPLRRAGTDLTFVPRGPGLVIRDGRPVPPAFPPSVAGPLPVPAVQTGW
jgi:predicted acylesterase/phospholipase RssA